MLFWLGVVMHAQTSPKVLQNNNQPISLERVERLSKVRWVYVQTFPKVLRNNKLPVSRERVEYCVNFLHAVRFT